MVRAVALAAAGLGLARSASRGARRRVLRSEVELVGERYRALLHESADLLHQLGSPSTDPRLEPGLRSSAADVAARVRASLHTQLGPAPVGLDLARLLASAASGFDDLAVDLAVDLTRGVRLPVQAAATLEQAVTSLLHAVRRDGRASHVLIHADVDRVRSRWEVVVREDGECAVGHVPATQVVVHDLGAWLAPVEVQVEVVSHRGEGSAVTFHGPLGSASQVVL